MRKLILKRFSKKEDEIYLQDLKDRRDDVKHYPALVGGTLGTLGAATGGLIGYGNGSKKGALIGTAIGGVAGGVPGYLMGRHGKRKVLKKLEGRDEEYLNANERERKYLRERAREELMAEVAAASRGRR